MRLGCKLSSANLSDNLDGLAFKAFIFLSRAGQQKGVRLHGPTSRQGFCPIRGASSHPRNHIGTPNPMGLFHIRFRPLRRMVGMRMIKADDIQPATPCLLLDADQLLRRDVVAIVSRVRPRIFGRALHRSLCCRPLPCDPASTPQHSCG